MTTLEARARRETLAKEIRMMAARAEDWTDADKAAWQITNTEYDRIDADLLQNRPPFGRDAASLNGLIGSDRSSSADMAVAAWCRNAHGTPIPRDEFDAALQFGQDPRGSAIEVRLRAGRPTRGLQVFNSQSTIPGRDGGFLVPGGFMPRLESALKSFSGMMQSSEIWITEFGHETPWPTVDDTSNVGYQLGENHETTETGMTFGAKIFRNYKMSSGLVRVSHELLRDNAVNLAGAIGDKLGERLGRILNDKTTNGSGAATIEGILTGATVGKTAASQTAISMDDLIQLQHSVDPGYKADPAKLGWQMNSTTASFIRRLKTGTGEYLWEASTVLGQPSLLLGDPVYLNQSLPDIGTGSKPVLYGKLDSYKLRIVTGVRLRTLQERFAEFDQVGFLGFLECDGALLNPSATAALCPVRVLQMAP